MVRGVLLAALAAGLVASLIAIALPRARQAARFLHSAKAPVSAPRHRPRPGLAAASDHARPQQAKVEATLDEAEHILGDVGVALGLLLAASAAAAGLLASPRLLARRRRVYEAFRIYLTANDQTELKNMTQAVGAMGQAVATRPAVRWRRGKPAFGLLVGYSPSDGGELTLAVVCEREVVPALDGALTKAYPNVRVGFDRQPCYQALEMQLGVPPVVVRLRKRREPFHPIIDLAEEEGVDTVLEGLADMMHALRTPAAAWFCVVPADTGAGYLRARHRRSERYRRHSHERPLSGPDGRPEPEATVDRAETSQSAQIGERSTFYVDVQIAGRDYATCQALAGTLQNLPGATNTLVRRPMFLRRRLYRRRFPSFTPPLIMRGRDKVMTDSELAGLLQLPSARLTAPIQRIPEPRLPASPGIAAPAVENEWDYTPVPRPAGVTALSDEELRTMLGTDRRERKTANEGDRSEAS